MTQVVADPGEENELRLRQRLWADPLALDAVRGLGLSDETIRRHRLGLKEPYAARGSGLTVSRALAFPVLDLVGGRTGRWSYATLPGLTSHAPHPEGWGPGLSRTCYSHAADAASTIVVVSSPVTMWLLSQALSNTLPTVVVACRSHPGGVPAEWRDPSFWRRWDTVILGMEADGDGPGARVARTVATTVGGEVLRCAPPRGEAWDDLVRTGGSAAEIAALLAAATPWRPMEAPARASLRSAVGDFEADPVVIEGAVVNGLMHYPITVERREIEGVGDDPAVVQRYVTRILRGDGVVLDIERLPAPRGTPAGGRVLALSDGTRIASEPLPARFATWRYNSVRRFIEARATARAPDRRELVRILADVECHLRSCVWLPHDQDFALAAAFVVATFVHRVFDAFPILLVNGLRGTGKSELGQALSSISCNGVVAGRISPAGLVRLLAESRGTVVLDDLEAISSNRTAGTDLAQVLKIGYKASTARRVTPGRDGRIEILDFYAPKIVTNISGADPVLLSRMIAVRTAAMPAEARLPDSLLDVADVRDELHTWAMCQAAAVAEVYRPLRSVAVSRRDEIAAPLRAVAALSDDDAFAARLELALAAEVELSSEPIDALAGRALRTLVAEGMVEVAMPHLLLEMAVEARGPVNLPSAETLGRTLLSIGARGKDDPVDRRRLHGEVTRIYRLAGEYVARVENRATMAVGAFAFCTRGPCSSCRYDGVCDTVTPGLRAAKR